MKIIDKRNSLVKHKSKTYNRRARNEIRNIAIHHSATTSGSAEAFARYHVNQLDWPGVAYHYVINQDGTIDQCHDPEVVTYHVGNSNRRALGVCMVGDFRVQDPTKEQWNALYDLLVHLMSMLNVNANNVWGHQEFPGYSWKPCPSLSMEQIRSNLIKNKRIIISPVKESASMSVLKRGDRSPDVKTLQENLNSLGHNCGVADGIFGPATENAVKSFQRSANLTVDGIAGPQTLSKMQTVLQAANKVTAPKKEQVTFSLGGRKYKIEEV